MSSCLSSEAPRSHGPAVLQETKGFQLFPSSGPTLRGCLSPPVSLSVSVSHPALFSLIDDAHRGGERGEWVSRLLGDRSVCYISL